MLFDFATLPPGEGYKLMVSTIVPRPIAWVVTLDAEGRPNAAPFSFFNAFSGNPPIIGFGCGPRPEGSPKDTLANIRRLGEFTVCLVPDALAHQMNITAADFETGINELEEAGLATRPGAMVKTPRIAESPVAMECVLHQIVPLGPHNLILGRILAMEVRDDCVLDPEKHYIDTPKLELIGRMHGRGWYARTTDRMEIPRITPEQWEEQKRKRAAE
ncbi:MAG: flavin reductase family protein [Acetobacteraceae bacterium]|nr:flavin reductase family protein [Acetobacteraceae bacterium]